MLHECFSFKELHSAGQEPLMEALNLIAGEPSSTHQPPPPPPPPAPLPPRLAPRLSRTLLAVQPANADCALHDKLNFDQANQPKLSCCF